MKFKKWFEAQFGEKPNSELILTRMKLLFNSLNSINSLQKNDLKNIIYAGEAAEELLNKIEEYDAKMEAALYAWNMSEAYKKQEKP